MISTLPSAFQDSLNARLLGEDRSRYKFVVVPP